MTLDEIKKKINIVDIISRTIPLKESGRSLNGNCVFCNGIESFYVHPKYQFYHCFCCQASGDVFRFVAAMEKKPFEQVMIEFGAAMSLISGDK